MNVNMLPAYFLGGVFTIATAHLLVECVLGVRRRIKRRNTKPIVTYGVLWPNGAFEDIRRTDYEALVAQGHDEITDAAWDDEIDLALGLTRPQPAACDDHISAILAHNEAARELTDEGLRQWMGEGK